MNAFDILSGSAVNLNVQQLGWVLLHSLWQFLLIAIFSAVVLQGLQRFSASSRYTFLVFALVVCVLCPVATWYVHRVDAANHAPSLGVSRQSAKDSHVAQEKAMELFADQQAPEKASKASQPAAPNSAEPLPITRSWLTEIEITFRPWLAWIVGLWTLGVAICAMRPALSWVAISQLRRKGTTPVSPELLEVLRRVSQVIGVTLQVQLLQSKLVHVPIVVGYLRPLILLPVSLLSNFPVAQLEAILAHELAHVHRHDFLVNLWQTIVETLFFYHPAVWWISQRIRIEREHCCDDLVVQVLGNPGEYGRALLAIEQSRGASGVLALGASDGSMLSRIRRIVAYPRNGRVVARWSPLNIFASSLVIAALMGLLSWQSIAQTGSEPPADTNQDPPAIAVEAKPEIKSNRVVDAQGKPIAGAKIDCLRSMKYSWLEAPKSLGVTVSDSEGLFDYPAGLPAKDQFYVYVSAEGFLERVWAANHGEAYVLEQGKRKLDTLVLRRPVTVAGQILGLNGKPLADAEIAVDYMYDNGWCEINGNRVKSDAAGRFVARGLEPANLFVRYESPDATNEEGMPVGIQAGKLCIVAFTATDGQQKDDVVLDLSKCICVVEGVIVDHEEQGVANRWIQATIASANPNLFSS